jgi:hypothetical protein
MLTISVSMCGIYMVEDYVHQVIHTSNFWKSNVRSAVLTIRKLPILRSCHLIEYLRKFRDSLTTCTAAVAENLSML